MRISRLALVPALVVAVGCFQGRRVIKVNADGSGTITDTMVLGEEFKALAAAAEKDKTAAQKAEEKEKFVKTAAAMGPGVTFEGEKKTADGITATFAFKDISKIKVDVSPGPDSGEQGQAQKQPPLTFRFARQGGKSILTVVQPQPKKASASPSEPNPMQAMASGMWDMMKPMMKGLKLDTFIEVNGNVTRTNSRLAEGSRITLLAMDFDQISADAANFKKFTKAGEDPSTLDPALLQGVKGVKVNPEPEVTIEFTGR